MQGMNVIFRCTFHRSHPARAPRLRPSHRERNKQHPGTSMKTERPHIAGGRPNNALRPPADNRTTEYNAHIVPRGDAPKTHTDDPTAAGLGLAMPLGS